MRLLKSSRPFALSLALGAAASLLLVSCVSDEPGTQAGTSKLYGTLKVSLVEATTFSDPYASLVGRVNNGSTPSAVKWVEQTHSGSCKLLKPTVPFCDPGCGSSALCVEDGVCKAFPVGVSVGRLTVEGVKLQSGPTSFTVDPVNKNYVLSGGASLAYPPFAEGDVIKVKAAGDTAIGSFSLTTRGIKALQLLNDTIVLADGQPLTLLWTPPGSAGAGASTVSARFDISHHGGVRGVIECEGPDNGQLVVAATLVDQLKALGVSGFPNVKITRQSVDTLPGHDVELVLESSITRELRIPGLTSCTEDTDCPGTQTCQQDFKCQ